MTFTSYKNDHVDDVKASINAMIIFFFLLVSLVSKRRIGIKRIVLNKVILCMDFL